jgi:hypothetical protein
MAYTDIDKPSDYFNTITYTGDGNTRSLTGVGFQPDWVWVKERNGTNSHNLWDIVRGATKGIFSDQTTAELTNAASGYLTSFDSDGFSVQAGAGSIDNLNRSSGTYACMELVSWWLCIIKHRWKHNLKFCICFTLLLDLVLCLIQVMEQLVLLVGHGLGAVPQVL